MFAIPKLQREFVWNGSKAAEWLDSIYRGMPIGSILIWETGKKNGDLLRPALHILPPFDPGNKLIWYLIDGQQRLSVLHQAVRGERKENSSGQMVDFGRLSFRLDHSNGDGEVPAWFAYRKPVDGQFVSVADILANNWKKRLKGLGITKLKRVADCRDRLLTYPVPVIMMSSPDLDGVRDAFIRINSARDADRLQQTGLSPEPPQSIFERRPMTCGRTCRTTFPTWITRRSFWRSRLYAPTGSRMSAKGH